MRVRRKVIAWVTGVVAAVTFTVGSVVILPHTFAAAAQPCDPDVAPGKKWQEGWIPFPACLPSEAQMSAAVRTQPNGAFFWTGGVMDLADEIARRFGGTTLEGALDRAGIALPQMGTPRSPEGDAAWTYASQQLAAQASGIAFVVKGEQPREGNIWETEEFPRLQQNPEVPCVIKIDAVTGEETVIYVREGSGYDVRRCLTERSTQIARMACPIWQAAAWPRGAAGQARMIEWPNDPDPQRPEVLYGGEPLPSNTHDLVYSIAPWFPEPTPSAVEQHLHSTPVMVAHFRTGVPETFDLYLDIDDPSFRRVNPEDIGCRPYDKQLKKRDSPAVADPSAIKVGNMYYSVESADGSIFVRTAPTLGDLLHAQAVEIWRDSGMGEIWAPEITSVGGRYYVYFSAGAGAAHRMYVIDSDKPDGDYGWEQKLNLPDDKWAIDGSAFTFNNQLWFVWSGWEGDTNVEQNLYLARMSNPTTPTGARYVISQPRENWERVVGDPFINEAPEAIKDPNGQLHIVYSTNGSWSDQYCLADLRLRAGGDPTYVWDWYKSNGCLFGSHQDTMMSGWPVTTNVNGPGHHTFALTNGDIANSPSAVGVKHGLLFHAVAKGTDYDWKHRTWYEGGFNWWKDITYSRANVPGDNTNTGYSLGFYEDRNSPLPPPPAPGGPGRTSIHNQDPSVIRVGSTYYSVESDGTNIYSRSASSIQGLAASAKTLIWSSPKNLPNVWAPELVKMPAALGTSVYAIYFASGDGKAGQRMFYTWSNSPNRNFSDPISLKLPDNKWAVDGTAFNFNNQLWFVWSGWQGDTNVEQNLYIAKMNSPSEVTGKRYIISQPRESWERVVGNPFINEAPEAIKDPNGQLHIVYSANGSWSDQYCLADLRLRAGGDPTYVWDWYKSNGCLFGSNRDTMMAGWDPTLYANGPGHNSFVLLDGDINTSPPAGPTFPLMFHAVPKGTEYKWENRMWYTGTFCWWGNTTYSRQNVPSDNNNTGWSLKFFE